jgi:hypothetical protein
MPVLHIASFYNYILLIFRTFKEREYILLLLVSFKHIDEAALDTKPHRFWYPQASKRDAEMNERVLSHFVMYGLLHCSLHSACDFS